MHDDLTLVGVFLPYKIRKKFKFLRRFDFIEIWHRDPQSLAEVDDCDFDDYKKLSHWRHWEVRFLPFNRLTSKLFQRCAECGGPSIKGNPVNVGLDWEYEKLPFWWNRTRVFHQECGKKYLDRSTIANNEAINKGYQAGYLDGIFELDLGSGFNPPLIRHIRSPKVEQWNEHNMKSNEKFLERLLHSASEMNNRANNNT